MQTYIKRKKDEQISLKDVVTRIRPSHPLVIEPEKKVKLDQRIQQNEGITQIFRQLKEIKEDLNDLKKLKNQQFLAIKKMSQPQLTNSVVNRPTQKPIIKIQQDIKLERTPRVARKVNTTFVKAPNQLVDEELSQSSQGLSDDRQFIPES